jgi:hypothetical protein
MLRKSSDATKLLDSSAYHQLGRLRCSDVAIYQLQIICALQSTGRGHLSGIRDNPIAVFGQPLRQLETNASHARGLANRIVGFDEWRELMLLGRLPGGQPGDRDRDLRKNPSMPL